MSDARLEKAKTWLTSIMAETFEIKPLSGDASFRRYFRVHLEQTSWVLMDAPPAKEDTTPFLNVLAWLEQAGLRVPHLQALDRKQGFLLLEDFGDVTWARHIEAGGDTQALFTNALNQLHTLQISKPTVVLLNFDMARMQRECDLFLDWYLPKVCNIELSDAERNAFHIGMTPSLKTLAALPQAPVHLDYHSRNLMLPDDGLPLGIIDFQDAVQGHITYDLASLLYDCYQDYPEPIRHQWSASFFNALPATQQSYFDDVENWHQMLRLTALQRHIKAIGIFSRLAYRDGKKKFLNEIPLTRKHLWEEIPLFDLPDIVVDILKQVPSK